MQISVDKDGAFAELSRLRAAIDASGDVIYDWDLATGSIAWSGRAEALFDPEESFLPQDAEDFHTRINPVDLPRRMHALSEHLSSGAIYDCEYRIRVGSGAFQWVHDRGKVTFSASGTPSRVFGLLRLVTQRKEHEARLEHLANFDELTGHFNKERLREALDHAVEQGLRFGRTGAFLVVGLDQMGMVNTAYGYEAGDTVLVTVGQRLDRCLRASDIVGRIGSDRFGIVLSCCDDEEASRAAERILTTVRTTPVDLGERRVGVTASVSIVLFPQHAKTAVDVMTKAEGALLQAKTAGRDCIIVYEMSEEQRRVYRDSMDIGEQVKRALQEDRLTFAYQPVVDAKTEAVAFFECLLRMRGTDGELVPAGRFIPAVEQLGLMRTIDRRVLDLAVRDLEANPEITLAINISGLTAADRAWLRALTARLKGRRDLAKRLIVEITETAALHDIEDSARFVSAVRALGCQVAVDDFGAGYTTFKHLKSLTVDVVKIDGSFVRDISKSSENQIFIRNLLSLAETFGLATVAEFVETAEDAEYLAGEGVDYLQGYFFGKPMDRLTYDKADAPSERKAATGF
ncbi:MAG: EAL domain-containing protein [Kiloniellales bacterium]|nr:EAL domain-containing protein [Kiloniellales bacterium]